MKLKSAKFITLVLTSILGITVLGTNPVFSADVCSSNATQAVKDAAGCNGTGDQLPQTIQNILNSIIFITGIIAVVFVIVGGVQYMTSSGDANKVKKAKDTILYAVIGLIVCVLSFAIVNFVIVKILK